MFQVQDAARLYAARVSRGKKPHVIFGTAIDTDLKLIAGMTLEEIEEIRYRPFDFHLEDGFHEFKSYQEGTSWFELPMTEYEHAVAAADDGIETFITMFRQHPPQGYSLIGTVKFSDLRQYLGPSSFSSPMKIDGVWHEVRGFFCSLNRAISLTRDD